MPFPFQQCQPISNKDLVSFVFDDPTYPVDRPLLINPENPSEHFTHRTACRFVRQVIAGLHAHGLKKGDTVCTHSFNSLIYPLLVLAIVGAGGISVGTNPAYTKHELNHAVKIAKIRFVLCEEEILPNMLAALKENNIDIGNRVLVLNDQAPAGLKSWKALLNHGEEDWIRFDDGEKADQMTNLYFTSGTSGLPKCAMTSHRNMVAQHQIAFEQNPKPYPYKIVLCMPFFHLGIAPQAIVSSIRDGRETYVMRRFDLLPYLQYHAKYDLTEIFSVPPMVVAIVMSGLADPNSPNYRKDCSLKSVRNGFTGAAPLSGDMERRIQRLCSEGATWTQGWGMTETTCIAAVPTKEHAEASARGEIDASGSVGTPLPGLLMKLIDEHGNDITHSGKGELCVKGPTIVKGYFENEKATKDGWDAEGFFKTGDVIEVNPKTGLMSVVDRVKELIKVRGFQVAPAELEGELTAHPNIIDAAVIGIRKSDEVELPRAYVVRRSGSNLTEDQVQAYMKERLAKYKQLEGGVVFVDTIPKSASGKILKRILRDEQKIAARL